MRVRANARGGAAGAAGPIRRPDFAHGSMRASI
jgi:hypothetical protein